MKKYILALMLIFGFSSYAQEVKYFDSPFGGGGGYTPAWYIPNFEPLNRELKNFGVPDLSSSGFYSSGGAGFIYLSFVPGLRAGGMGFGGSTSEEAVSNGFDREVVYSIGGGGITLEYTLPIIKNIGVSVGATLGGGSLTIDLYRNKGNFNWDDVWSESVSDSSANLSRSITNSYWFVAPTLNIEFPILRFMAFRIGAGYQVSFGDSWTIENGKDLSGVPSDVSGNSFFIQTGIFVGFFSF